MKKKTGKTIATQLSHVIKDHPKMATGVAAAAGLVTGLVTLVSRRKRKAAGATGAKPKGKATPGGKPAASSSANPAKSKPSKRKGGKKGKA